MTSNQYEALDQSHASGKPSEVVDALIAMLRDKKEYHKLFEALLLKAKLNRGVVSTAPMKFDDLPEQERSSFENEYIEVAREIGQLFLDEGRIVDAWLYLGTIGEKEKIVAALDDHQLDVNNYEENEQLINIALHEGAYPVKGLEWLLATHGICNTITSLDQCIGQLSPEERRQIVKILVQDIHSGILQTVGREIQQKSPDEELEDSLPGRIQNRDWLFTENNYHVDVSHLHSVVRFARFLDPGDAEISSAIDLAEYGCRLSDQFRYPGDPPFEDFYPAHIHYFRILQNEGDNEASLAFFQSQLANEELHEDDRRMAAYVLADLLRRVDKPGDALTIAFEHLKDVDEASGFSLAELCRDANRPDLLKQLAQDRNDAVTYTVGLLLQK